MAGENTTINPPNSPKSELKARFRERYETAKNIAADTIVTPTHLRGRKQKEIEHNRRILAARIGRELIGQERIHETELNALREKEFNDPLTGLLSMEGFNKRLVEEITRAKREGKNIAVMILDLNGLKEVNDSLGHDIGDQRIIAAADVISSSFRPTDLVARRGTKADEFIVALEVDNLDQVREYYQRITENSKPLLEYWDGKPMVLPAGATLLNFENVAGSMREADAQMYTAKEASRLSNQNTISLSLAQPGKAV